MNDWNVVVTTRDIGYRDARQKLAELGRVERTHYRGVLVMHADDISGFLDALDRAHELEADAVRGVSRVIPVTETFFFQSPEEFEEKVERSALSLLSHLAGRSFHVRMHRRGFKGRLVRPVEERWLDEKLLAALEQAGTPGRIDFDNPDVIIAIETVDTRGGLSLWRREDRQRHAYLRLD